MLSSEVHESMAPRRLLQETEMESQSRLWMVFVGLAGLCWGVYVPLIAQGGKGLKNSYAAILCVGVAYFVIAIVLPLLIMWWKQMKPAWNADGVVFATLAGAAGALGALCVVFATFQYGGNRLYVAPVIFALAPVINTIVSLLWQPAPGSVLHIGAPAQSPGWKFYLGMVLAGLGAALVLYSKEELEKKHGSLKSASPTAQMASIAKP
jgi:hypothetical protein